MMTQPHKQAVANQLQDQMPGGKDAQKPAVDIHQQDQDDSVATLLLPLARPRANAPGLRLV